MATAATPLLLFFDFGGVISANAWPAMREYQEHVFDTATAPLLSADASLKPVAAVVRRFASLFFTAVNKYEAFATGAPSAWMRLEEGKLTRSAYCAAFPEISRKCLDGLFRPRAEKHLKRATPDASPAALEAAVSNAMVLLRAFAAALDVDTLVGVIERSPLRRNVMELLGFVRAAADRAGAPVRMSLVTNNWESMPVGSTLEAAKAAVGAADGPGLRFDTVIESLKVGMRKPDSGIFVAARQALQATLPAGAAGGAPPHAVFFDDLQVNCKGAVASGACAAAVLVKGAHSVYAGVVDALVRAGHSVLADEVRSAHHGRFGDAAADSFEATANCAPPPPPVTPNLLPANKIPAKQRFNADELQRLFAWLRTTMPLHFPMHLACVAEGGAPIIEYFRGGMSNPTFRMTLRTGVFVLRKQPKGKLLAGAHDVRREYDIMRHLHGTGDVPAPHCLGFCSDSGVIGTPFYVMKFLPGTIFRTADELFAARDPRGVVTELVDVLVRLHRAGPPPAMRGAVAKSREALRKPAAVHPILRVVRTWKGQYDRGNKQLAAAHSKNPATPPAFDVPEFVELTQKLEHVLLATRADERLVPLQEPTLVHGDYKIDNMIFNLHNAPTVAALLDFELSHVSDPLADLAYFVFTLHYMPPPRGVSGLEAASQLPSAEDIVARYLERTGLLPSLDAKAREGVISAYIAQAAHKLAGIIHGVVCRAMIGNASDVERGLKMREMVAGLSMLGIGVLEEGGAVAAESKSKL